MHFAEAEMLGWRVETWEAASGAAPSQDAKLVVSQGRRLRAAVIDGVTPTDRTPSRVGVDGAMYAATLVRLALQDQSASLRQAALAANRELYDPRLSRSRDQMQTCLVGVDLQEDGSMSLLRAGDCEAWATDAAGAWHRICGSDMLVPCARDAYQAWTAAHPHATREEAHRAEEELWGRAEAWQCSAIGRFAEPSLLEADEVGISQLVLASDGARLTQSALVDIDQWLAGLRTYEEAHHQHERKPHDDVTVMRITRRP